MHTITFFPSASPRSAYYPQLCMGKFTEHEQVNTTFLKDCIDVFWHLDEHEIIILSEETLQLKTRIEGFTHVDLILAEFVSADIKRPTQCHVFIGVTIVHGTSFMFLFIENCVNSRTRKLSLYNANLVKTFLSNMIITEIKNSDHRLKFASPVEGFSMVLPDTPFTPTLQFSPLFTSPLFQSQSDEKLSRTILACSDDCHFEDQLFDFNVKCKPEDKQVFSFGASFEMAGSTASRIPIKSLQTMANVKKHGKSEYQAQFFYQNNVYTVDILLGEKLLMSENSKALAVNDSISSIQIQPITLFDTLVLKQKATSKFFF